MATMNFLMHLSSFDDSNRTNDTDLNHFDWTRQVQGLSSTEIKSSSCAINPGDTLSILDKVTTVTHGTGITYSLSLKTDTTNTYVLQATAGTPGFRTDRNAVTGGDTYTITSNGPIMTITAPGLDESLVTVGDTIRMGDEFSSTNQGEYKIIGTETNAVHVENDSIVDESIAGTVSIYSSDGLQIGEYIQISNGFFSSTFGTYQITDVAADYIEFYSASTLAEQTGISDTASGIFSLYQSTNKIIYIESFSPVSVEIDGATIELEPLVDGSSTLPATLFQVGQFKKCSVTNNQTSSVTVKFLTAE